MRHHVIKATGFLLTALVVFGLVLTVLSAAISGEPFYGVSYKGLPLGTYSTLTVLVLAAVFAIVAGVARVRSFMRRRAAESSRG